MPEKEQNWVISRDLLALLWDQGLIRVAVNGQPVDPDVALVAKPELVTILVGTGYLYVVDCDLENRVWSIYSEMPL